MGLFHAYTAGGRGQEPQGQKPQGQKPQGQKPQGQKPQCQKPQCQKPQGQKRAHTWPAQGYGGEFIKTRGKPFFDT